MEECYNCNIPKDHIPDPKQSFIYNNPISGEAEFYCSEQCFLDTTNNMYRKLVSGCSQEDKKIVEEELKDVMPAYQRKVREEIFRRNKNG